MTRELDKPRRDAEGLAAPGPVGTRSESLFERVEVHVRRGLIDVLRSDEKLEVSISEEERWCSERVAQLARGGVVILDERAERHEAVGLRSARPDVGLLVLAHEPTYIYGVLLLAAGITCLSLPASATAILHAVHVTAQGGCVFVSPDEGLTERPDRRKDRLLTKRETDVLVRFSSGMSPAKIAIDLCISVETVRAYTTSLRHKLRLSSARDLVGLYIPSALTIG